ncbi:GumC family protein [Vampirovibrio chlorellavorus]|uniref:GumC family protein n=1 Tax=Vampirovibrio chlorellavorus TaxID=758823 RepID=UPI0026EB5BDA|nr:GNVR domain-containing protein [Vampirovibrio chlorellavorus]
MAPVFSPAHLKHHALPEPPERLLPGVASFWRRNTALIVGVGLFVCFWMLIYTFFVFKPGYAAKAMVIIKDSAITSRYVEPDQYYALQTTSSSSSNPVLNTMGILKSSAISEALWQFFQSKHPEQLKKLKIKTPADWKAFYQDGSAFIKAKNQPGTDLISVQFSWSDPVIAKEGLGVVLKAFQNASRDLNRSEQSTRTQFLEGQVRELEAQLLAVRKLKSTYQISNKTVSVRREGDDLAGSRMELSNRLSQLEAQAQGKERLARRYQQLLGMNPEKALKASALGQNATIARLQDELYRLQQQYALLSASLTESNPKVREIEAQIAQVKANLSAEQSRTMGTANNTQTVVADTTRGDLVRNMLLANGEAQDLRAQAAIIRQRLGQINVDISQFPQKAEGLAQIEQKEASLSVALDHLRQKALEGRVKEAQTLSNVFIVDEPSLPQKAQFPNRTHLIVLSLLMGLGVGMATAFAKEQLSGPSAGYSMPEWMEPLEGSQTTATMEEVAEVAEMPEMPETRQPSTRPAGPRTFEPEPAELSGGATPFSLAHTLMSEPTSEKMGLPAAGSLFDSLIPVAGPITQQYPTAATFRSDLTQPLTAESVRPSPSQQTERSSSSPHRLQPLLAHPLENPEEMPVPPSAISPAASVRMAHAPTPHQLAELQAAHLQKTNPPLTEQEGVPVLHAPPVAAEVITSDLSASDLPLDSEDPSMAENRPITHEPIRFKAPSQVTVQAEAPAPHSESMLEAAYDSPSSAEHSEPQNSLSQNSLYDQQALKMPMPRRKRGVPAFLLSDETQSNGQSQDGHNSLDGYDPEETGFSQPYTLIPKKQRLSADDNLLETVAPLSAPSPAAPASENLPFPDLFSETDLAETDSRPRPPALNPPLNPMWISRKPYEHPEAYFGLGRRKKKRMEPSTSLNRLMAALQQQAGVRKP